MDLVSSILDIVTRLFDCTVSKCSYIRDLEENLRSLSEKKSELEAINVDVKRRVETEEQLPRKRTKVVEVWLHAVESEQKEMDVILHKGNREIQKKCLGSCFTKNCYSSYKIGKEVEEKISKVTQLRFQGENFEKIDVTYKLPRPPVDGMVTEKTVGIDSTLDQVWRCIEDQSEQIIGLYGMGGVGKTTLLKKLNNKFLDVNHHFDLVIWVAVSRDGNLEKIQEAIRKKLDISDDFWKLKGEFDRAGEILIGLRRKKFVLLLDDVWERLDLSKIGVTVSDSPNGSKIVFTTRSEGLCGHMEASRTFKVECLSPEVAMELFRLKVGEYVFNSHPEIPMLAQVVVEECKGLPLALITIARAMSFRRSPREWQYAIEELRSNPSRFAGIGNLVFPILRFSYDSLTNDTLKKCFLYCSLFPEEHNIRKDELIDLWIGEGFLRDFSSINKARNEGEYIIGSLKLACLIETGEYSEDFVKMHDLIRDMALWLASNENKILLQRSTDQKKKSADSWSEALRLSLWGSSFESLPQAPSCPLLQTLLVRFTVLDKFPLRFLESMSALEVLDLSYNLDLTQLPAGIGALVNLRYLNLSNTSIREVPIEIMYLKNLTILLLDGMLHLLVIKARVISSLSSLQVFSLFTTEVIDFHHTFLDDTIIVKELMCLEKIDEISFTVWSVNALSTIIESVKLGSSVKRLRISYCFDLPSVNFFCMERLETLNIVECSLRSINVNPSRNPSWSSYTFPNLHHLSIHECPVMIDLRWVIEAPNLQFLSLKNCGELSEIIEGYESVGSSEMKNDYLSSLMVVELESLPSLKRICYGTLPFPSLQTLSVTNCPNLRNLPFNSESANNSLNAIRGSAEWWEQLQWEDQPTKHVFAKKFLEL